MITPLDYFRYCLIPLVLFFPTMAGAEMKTRIVEYRQGDTVLQGFLAYDTAGPARKPGVLVVHEWTGLGPYVKNRAEQLARLGYVAFAADIYGKGVRPNNPKDAAATATLYKTDRNLLRERVKAALEELRHQGNTDPGRIAAIGYCFGGTTVLELARSGADIKGIVSFHGGLDTPSPQDAKNIRAKVLVLHGADDPFVTSEQVKSFEDEMRGGNVDWQLVKYSKAVHSFTNPDAGNDNSKGAAYNAEADRRSWEEMKSFFNEIF
ncbi:Dienelactone hydrolase [Georgfuchsia toluolica]|uniref:Dienelactone hydrolase n=1 Tax=Georgfuchsia toluolica TaxID=424218 RepID=A0A916J621_9PROT|nr:dienelactone hydrolase family protein [Georgfuchsia toluolica]CAG4884611.1 Dienelactone hydrolase [Georgfuchsia toluolica]